MKSIFITFIIIIILICIFDIDIGKSYNIPLYTNVKWTKQKIIPAITTEKSKKWYQCKIDDKGSRLIRNLLEKYNIVRTFGTDWNIILPCNQNYKYKDLTKINVNNQQQIISYMSGSGVLGSKERLWKNLLNYYGRYKAETIMPPTYIFPQDTEIFFKRFNKNNTYILKNEKQRQNGLKITKNKNEIVNHHKLGYCIVQQYLGNSLKYNEKKINLRIYLLHVVGKHNTNAYIYDDGIVSYTLNPESNIISFSNGVSSFYNSKEAYNKGYPITINTLKPKLPNANWSLIFNKIKLIAQDVITASKNQLGNYNHKYNNTSYQLFGMDFYVSDKYDVKLLEINIGPGMTPYNDIDKDMRIKLHENILHIIGMIDNTPNQSMIKL